MMTKAAENNFQDLLRRAVAVVMLSLSLLLPAMTPADSLQQVLPTLTTSADSLPVMFDLLDCTHYTKRRGMLERIFETARRADNQEAMLGAMFQLASFYEGERGMEPILLEMLEHIPASDARRRMAIYIKVRYTAYAIRDLAEKERQVKLLATLGDYKENSRLFSLRHWAITRKTAG